MDVLTERSKTNPQLNKTLTLINALPDDISRKIYEDYFQGKELCIRFLTQLEDENSVRLEYQKLMGITEQVLRYPCVVEYLRKKSDAFNRSYITHFVENNKQFRLLNHKRPCMFLFD